MEPVKTLLVADYGGIKTAKSTMALSMPKPLVDFDFDQSFDRAAGRYLSANPHLKVKRVYPDEDLDPTYLDGQFDIIVVSYKVPLKFPGRPREGFLPLWEDRVIPDFLKVYDSPIISSVMVDTGTVLWEIAHQAHLERVQKNSKEKDRQQLIRVEYARPSSEARALYGGARFSGKSLISVNHIGPKFGIGIVEERKGGRTERVFKSDMVIGETWKGFNQLGQIVDVVVRSRLEQKCKSCNKTFDMPANGSIPLEVQIEHGNHMDKIDPKPIPTITIEECGYTLEAQGSRIENPDFDGLLGLINAMRSASNGNGE